MPKVFCKKGVTLVELLAVIAIMGIITATVFGISYRNKKNAVVRSAADELAERINDLRQRALKGDVNGDTSDHACAFYIVIPTAASASSAYVTYYRKGGSDNPSCSSAVSGVNVPFFEYDNSKVTIRMYTGDGRGLLFFVPFARVYKSTDFQNDIVVTGINGGPTMHVCISDLGVAEVKNSCP